MLTVAQVKGAQPKARPYKLSDGGGLYLYVAPPDLRSWRMKFRYAGREKLLTFGTFPDVSLAQARDRRDDARRQLRDNIDPSGARRKALEAAAREGEAHATFEIAARGWHAHQAPRWVPVHAGDVLASLERDVFPVIGALALDAITPPMVLRMLREIEARGSVETARRVRQRVSAVFTFAASEGATTTDPAAIVRKALRPPQPKRRQPALLDLGELAALLDACEAVRSPAVVKLASRFLALTAVRLDAVRGARWDEFSEVDWGGGMIGPTRPLWRVPPARMKLSAGKKTDETFAHLVPLSREAIDVLTAARALARPGDLVFPGRGGRQIGEKAIGDLYDDAGYKGRHVPHGWRAAFSTLLNERYPADRAIIDQALAHVAKDKVEAAYNRAEHHARRRRLFQTWGTMLMAGSLSVLAIAITSQALWQSRDDAPIAPAPIALATNG